MESIGERVAAVRRFNRFYTRRIGVLQEGMVDSPFSLTELRVLYELAHWPGGQPTASELGDALGLDAGYLSRLLAGFRKRGLIAGRASEADGRQVHLSLTKHGDKTFAVLEARTSEEVAAMLAKLPVERQGEVVGAMQTIERLLDDGPAEARPPLYLLRPHRAGDMGEVVRLHGALYAREYGWDESFEALVAEITAKFVRDFDPQSERCWIVEKDGEVVGSVFLVRKSRTVAQLRLLIVDPKARGLGVGRRLVEECVRFARERGYRKITLWTQSMLAAARRIYEQAGFRRVARKPHRSFGASLVGESWELKL